MAKFIFENTKRKVHFFAAKIDFRGAKRCPGTGIEFVLVTSRVVFMSGRAVDLLMFSSNLLFIFSGLLALFLIIFAQS